MATLLIILVFGTYAILGIWAFTSAVIVLRSCIYKGSYQAWHLTRRFAIAAVPALITTIGFVALFASLDPLWPAQDASESQMESYERARDFADRMYFVLGLLHISTTAWSTKLFWRVLKHERTPN